MKQYYQNNDCGCQAELTTDNRSYKVGMTYVPWQKWRNLYDPATALQEGTVFADLNLIFCGKRGSKVCR